MAGRDEETVLRSNKETDEGACGSRASTSGGGADRRGGSVAHPRRAARDYRVDEDQQLSRAGDQGSLVLLSRGDEPLVERDQLPIPIERGRQRRLIETAAQPFATTGDVADADPCSPVVIERRKPGQLAGLPAIETADLGQAAKL